MSKSPELSEVTNILTAQTVINAHSEALVEAFDNTISRDGSTPNNMEADLDLNEYDLLNVGSINAAEIELLGVNILDIINTQDMFETTSDMEAATTDGDWGYVLELGGVKLYKNVSGTAVEQVWVIKPTFNTVNELLSSLTTGYEEGTIFYTEGLGFKVANDSATDHGVTNSGGTKFYPLTTDEGAYNIRQFGASLDGVTDDTQKVQDAIDWVSSQGGGNLVVEKGLAELTATTATDTLLSGDLLTTESILGKSCLVLRAGVTLTLVGGASLVSSDPTVSVVIALDCSDGGIIGRGGYGVINGNWDGSGSGHGIVERLSVATHRSYNMVYEWLDIQNVGSYGIGRGYGDPVGGHVQNVRITNTGADGIDHKSRYNDILDKPILYSDIEVSRTGQRTSITGSAGIDVRGQVALNNITVTDFAATGSDNVGVRFSSAIVDEGELRPSSGHSIMTNFLIDSGDTTIPTTGVVFLSSPYSKLIGGVIHNCSDGFRSGTASSGIGETSEYSLLSGITVQGATDTGIYLKGSASSVSDCIISGIREIFSHDRGNLSDGDTSLDLPVQLPTDSEVTKNGVTLTTPTDYTIGTDKTITFTAALIETDEIIIQKELAVGVEVVATGCSLTNVRVSNTTDRVLDTETPHINGAGLGAPVDLTLTVEDATSGTGNVATLSESSGNYSQQGGMVDLTFTCKIGDLTGVTTANQVVLHGLPLPAVDRGGDTVRYNGAVRLGSVDYDGYVTAELRSGDNYIRLVENRVNAGADYLDFAELVVNSQISISIRYPVL